MARPVRRTPRTLGRQLELNSTSGRVAGVDGCRHGWVAVLARVDGAGPTEVAVVANVADVVTSGLLALAIDIPIGLPDTSDRACDREARLRVGPRRSSVFPAPVRDALLPARPYAEVLAASRDACGRGLSRQAYNLLPKIAEVDALVTPAHEPWLVEAHPEVSFAAMNGTPLPHAKRSPAGAAQRRALVEDHFPDATLRVPGAAPDDVRDAYALAWTALRVAAGTAETLGDGARDRRGLAMRIVY